MPRKQYEYHFIYKTTNLKNGRFYIGMHSTSNLNDGYLGSGTRLRRAIRKHGKHNFKLEILEFLNSREELANREKELINEDLLKDPMCMNLKPGGHGGFVNIEHKIKFHNAGKKTILSCFKKGLETQSYLWKNDEAWATMMKKILSSNSKGNKAFTNRKHTDETKMKISEANKIKQSGVYNSQFDTCWITNGVENKKIKKIEYIPPGWKLGRIIKNKI